MKVAVLVGGIGRRMGMEKTEITLCGKKLIERALEKYSQYQAVFVCRDEEQAKKLSSKYDAEFIWDVYRNVGSIAGIHAALKHFGSCIVTAIDMPFVKPAVIEHLYGEGERTGCDALIPKHDYPEPLLAYYSERIADELENAIVRGIRKILVPLEKLNAVYYPVEKLRKFDKDLISFFNINTPDDLKRAERICSEMSMAEL
uniref:Molybdenum cofactor guanylyltransferase n=1 Tax=Archaeoglobus fulgidus TaxID=2234 RepID=A0A7C3ZS38_ARCFL